MDKVKYRKIKVKDDVVYDMGSPIGEITDTDLFIQIDLPPNLIHIIHDGRQKAYRWGDHIESTRHFIPRHRDSMKGAKQDCIRWAIENGLWLGTLQEAM